MNKNLVIAAAFVLGISFPAIAEDLKGGAQGIVQPTENQAMKEGGDKKNAMMSKNEKKGILIGMDKAGKKGMMGKKSMMMSKDGGDKKAMMMDKGDGGEKGGGKKNMMDKGDGGDKGGGKKMMMKKGSLNSNTMVKDGGDEKGGGKKLGTMSNQKVTNENLGSNLDAAKNAKDAMH